VAGNQRSPEVWNVPFMTGKTCLLILLLLFAQADDAWASTSLVPSDCSLLDGDDLYPPVQRERQGGQADQLDLPPAPSPRAELPAPADAPALEARPAARPLARHASLYVYMSLQR
jgi:hypothetical protein